MCLYLNVKSSIIGMTGVHNSRSRQKVCTETEDDETAVSGQDGDTGALNSVDIISCPFRRKQS